MHKSSLFVFILFLIALVYSAQAQTESITLRGLITLKNPSPQKTYRVTDAGKQIDKTNWYSPPGYTNPLGSLTQFFGAV